MGNLFSKLGKKIETAVSNAYPVGTTYYGGMSGAGNMNLSKIEHAANQMDSEEAKEFKKEANTALGVGTAAAVTLPFIANGIQAFRTAHPIFSGLIDAGLTIDGVRNALSDNGVKKTINYATDGNWSRAVASGTMDALDLLGGVGLIGDAVKGMRYLKQVPNFGTMLYDLTPNKPKAKRLIEAAMRGSDAGAVPRPMEFIGRLIDNSDLRNYIRTGKLPKGIELTKEGHMLPFNSAADAKSSIMGHYQGTLTRDGWPYSADDGVDYIDALLYQKPLNPELMTRVGNAATDAGPLSSYVNANYANKAQQIPVYDTGYGYGFNSEAVPLRQQKVESIGSNSDYPSSVQDFPYANGRINVAGHTVEHGILDNYQVVRGWDIWKFNPKDYMKKWIESPDVMKSSKLQQKFYKLFLEYIDAASTPIITRTQWDWRPMYPQEIKPFEHVVEGIKYKQGGTVKKLNKGKFSKVRDFINYKNIK